MNNKTKQKNTIKKMLQDLLPPVRPYLLRAALFPVSSIS
jgi:hypothetical protein